MLGHHEEAVTPTDSVDSTTGNQDGDVEMENTPSIETETKAVNDNEEPISGADGASGKISPGHRSRSRSARPNYKIDTDGLDILDDTDAADPDVDYDDPDNKDDDYKEYEDEEDKITTNPRKRRHVDEDDDEENVVDEGDESNLGEDDEHEEPKQSRSNSIHSSKPPHNKKLHVTTSVPVDEDGKPLAPVNEEYPLPLDAEGETKITEDGDLLGGREFLIRTFTLSDKGNRKFMLSTECARAVGYRDSYLFFQYNKNIFKFVLSQLQKNDLIERGILPYSYRSRQIALVTAKGIFKVFGAKIIRNGKNITDDYYAIS